MIKKYLKTFISVLLGFAFIFGIVGAVIYNYAGHDLSIYWLAPYLLIFFTFVSFQTYRILITPQISEFKQGLQAAKAGVEEAQRLQASAEKTAATYKASLLERSAGFPSLMAAVQEYEKARDESLAHHLVHKSHPAKSAAL